MLSLLCRPSFPLTYKADIHLFTIVQLNRLVRWKAAASFDGPRRVATNVNRDNIIWRSIASTINNSVGIKSIRN
ncbi:MAG: hypothetical protein HOJ16_01115 [Candidatus Peribacter sp.]|nr:hypothetical protein [Candidatus Peribacter sp.]